MNATHLVEIDLRSSLVDSPEFGHNRLQPEMTPAVRVQPGDVVIIDTRDGADGQVAPSTTQADLEAGDISRVHPLTGPIFVEGAEPGDILDVDILEIESAEFAFTIARERDGLAPELMQRPYLARWEIRDGVARSADIPGVAIRGVPFIGVMVVAPSSERMRQFAAREKALAEAGGRVMLPDPRHAMPAGDGLRTVPPREIGGNMDLKHLTAGSTLSLRVDVQGALLSIGDVHFGQGDGEVCGQGMEMQARVHLRPRLRKREEVRWAPRCPTLEFTEVPAASPRRFIATTGIPIDDAGRNHDNDLALAARNALIDMLDYLEQVRGFTKGQAYVIASVAVDLHISEAVNVPNGLVSAILPLDIFDDEEQ